MRVFVTGATVVVGRRLLPLLRRSGHEVSALARSEQQRGRCLEDGVGARVASLFEPAPLRAALEGQNVVVNLATHMPPMTARIFLPGAWSENDRIRRFGSANLVDAALDAGVGRFIQESFAPVYLDHGDDWIDESWPIAPTRYNRSIFDAEASARRFGERGGAPVVLRFAAFYGPDAGQLSVMVRLVRHGWAPLLGPAGSFISSISHDDAAAAVVASLDVPPGTYNVADDQPLRHREFVDALADAVGAPHPRVPPEWVVPLGGSVGRLLARSLRVSNRKLRGASAWAPRYPTVREGFPAAVAAVTRPPSPGESLRASP